MVTLLGGQPKIRIRKSLIELKVSLAIFITISPLSMPIRVQYKPQTAPGFDNWKAVALEVICARDNLPEN